MWYLLTLLQRFHKVNVIIFCAIYWYTWYIRVILINHIKIILSASYRSRNTLWPVWIPYMFETLAVFVGSLHQSITLCLCHHSSNGFSRVLNSYHYGKYFILLLITTYYLKFNLSHFMIKSLNVESILIWTVPFLGSFLLGGGKFIRKEEITVAHKVLLRIQWGHPFNKNVMSNAHYALFWKSPPPNIWSTRQAPQK